MTEQHPDALMSYTRFDDEQSGAYLTTFREKLCGEVRAHTGRPFHIFQDIEDIKWGQQFEQRIDQALETIMFFIPILTPSFFNSRFCRYELEKFLQREARLGRNDLVLPVYFIRVPALEYPDLRANDPLAQTLAARQRTDWRELRFEGFDTPKVRRTLAQMAEHIADALLHGITHHSSLVTPDMIEIPAGPFLMGSRDDDKLADDDEKPQHRLELPTYWIGKTPVTNAQFRPFVEGDGYTNRNYWTDAGWQWREEEGITQPRFWEDADWNGDDYPVVGVSWFEAVAYCRWLSAQTGQEFRLPSEAEWEKAARGSDGRIWPWGNTWEQGRCNSKETGIGKTTPVGQYSSGASSYGVLDMAGNVWEWCATIWKKDYPYQIEDEWSAGYLEQDKARARRGGAYWLGKKAARGAYRGNNVAPRSRPFSGGLRLASSSPPLGSGE